MPNYCQNTIVVKSADLTKFSEWLGDGKALLSKIAPTPKELTENGSDGWYDWRVDNWGTKWDVVAEIDQSDTEIIFIFDSAWAPPLAAMAKLSKLFPDITIRHSYIEEGMGFVGVNEFEGGEMVSEVCEDDSDSQAWKTLAINEFNWEPWADDES